MISICSVLHLLSYCSAHGVSPLVILGVAPLVAEDASAAPTPGPSDAGTAGSHPGLQYYSSQQYKKLVAEAVAECINDVMKSKREREKTAAVQTDNAVDKPDVTTTATNTDTENSAIFEKLMQGTEFSYLNPFAVSALNLHTINSAQGTLIESLRHQNEVLRDSLKRSEDRLSEARNKSQEDESRPLREIVLETVRDVLSEFTEKTSPRRRTRLLPPPVHKERDTEVFMDIADEPAPTKTNKRPAGDDEDKSIKPDTKRMKNGEDGLETQQAEASTSESTPQDDLPQQEKQSEVNVEGEEKPKEVKATGKTEELPEPPVNTGDDVKNQKKDADSDVELSPEALANMDKISDPDEQARSQTKKASLLSLPVAIPLKDLKASDTEAIDKLVTLQKEKDDLITKADIFLQLKRPSDPEQSRVQATKLHDTLRGMGRACIGNPSKMPSTNSLFSAIAKECPGVADDGPQLRMKLMDFITTFSASFIKVCKKL